MIIGLDQNQLDKDIFQFPKKIFELIKDQLKKQVRAIYGSEKCVNSAEGICLPFTTFFSRKQHTSTIQMESIQCEGASGLLTKSSRNACGFCAKAVMKKCWRNWWGWKQERGKSLMEGKE